jgi:hypothetical protein
MVKVGVKSQMQQIFGDGGSIKKMYSNYLVQINVLNRYA